MQLYLPLLTAPNKTMHVGWGSNQGRQLCIYTISKLSTCGHPQPKLSTTGKQTLLAEISNHNGERSRVWCNWLKCKKVFGIINSSEIPNTNQSKYLNTYLATAKIFRWILLISGDELDWQGGHRMNSLMLSQHPSIRVPGHPPVLVLPNMALVQKHIRLALMNNMDILPGLLSDIIDAWTEHSLSWCLGRPCQSLLREFSSNSSSNSRWGGGGTDLQH